MCDVFVHDHREGKSCFRVDAVLRTKFVHAEMNRTCVTLRALSLVYPVTEVANEVQALRWSEPLLGRTTPASPRQQPMGGQENEDLLEDNHCGQLARITENCK